MFSMYLKTTWRNLRANKAHSFINIAGLSVGITCSLLIFLWIQHERSVDQFHENGDRLFRVYEREYYRDHTDGNYDTPGLLAQEIKQHFPEVEDALMMQEDNHQAALQSNNKIIQASGTAAGEGLFTMFSYRLLHGDPKTALNLPDNIALSEQLANSLFGNAANAMGKTIRFDNKHDYTVAAVFENLPATASRSFDYLITWAAWLQDNRWATEWGNSGPLTFVLLKDAADAAKLDQQLTKFLDNYNKWQGDDYRIELGLQKFNEAYLHNRFVNGEVQGGRIEYVHLFTAVAVFILLIACINFMNLSTARSVKRAKEVGVRKAVGALRTTLIKQFIIEAILVTSIAVAIAVALTALCLPAFAQITGKILQLPFSNSVFWTSIVMLTILTGMVAGSYPALYLSSFNAIKVLKGIPKFSTSAVWFKKALVVVQFILSFVLITGTIVVSRQVRFIQQRNIGYDKENLVYIPMQGELRQKFKTFKTEALKLPGVQNISSITANPSNSNQQTNGVDWEGRDPNVKISVEHPNAGYDFVSTMKLQLVEGRDFSPDFSNEENGFLLNETAAKYIGYKNPVGKRITVNGRTATITGVVKDFHFRSLHEQIQPMIVEFDPSDNSSYILVRVQNGQTAAVLAGMEQLCKGLNPAFPFTYRFSDEEYQRLYQHEQVISKLSTIFAALAVVIASLGLLGLIMFAAEQRTKEIGIRKVLGASISSVVKLLSADFVKLIVLAVAIAAPLAWWAMHNWLQGYAYRVALNWWIFGAAGLLMLLVAVAIMSMQTIKSALANPVKSLRSE